MITSINELDLSKKYSYAEYLTWQFADRIELLGGYIRQMSAPNRNHQKILRNIVRPINNFFYKSPCQLFIAPFDVRLLDKEKSLRADKDIYTVVQPDLCVICDKSKLDDRGCIGSPDFIVEILSPNNSKTDLKDKFKLYEECGVLEYWIIYPSDKIIHKFLLENGHYQLKDVYSPTDDAYPTLFPTLLIQLTDVFEDE